MLQPDFEVQHFAFFHFKNGDDVRSVAVAAHGHVEVAERSRFDDSKADGVGLCCFDNVFFRFHHFHFGIENTHAGIADKHNEMKLGIERINISPEGRKKIESEDNLTVIEKYKLIGKKLKPIVE